MQICVKPFVIALCLAGLIGQPVLAATPTDKAVIDKLSSQVTHLQKELNSLKSQLKTQNLLDNPNNTVAVNTPVHRHAHTSSDDNQGTQVKPPIAAQTTAQTYITPQTERQLVSNGLTGKDLIRLIGESQTYLPFDLDVPGQAFVSTGPYVGVPVQYSGSHLIINSPSVNTDVQLLGIRKHIHEQLNLMGGSLFKEPYHSHLLLSGLVEVQTNYTKPGGRGGTSDIDVTNVSLDAFFLGPSDLLLGFIEFTYDNGPPPGTAYRVGNSRVYVNKAFITIGDLSLSPFYGTFGQFYVPFGTYSSLMVSDTLPKLLGRTKARALELGFQQQTKNALYGSVYVFRGDAHARANRINNGGINLGLKLQVEKFSANVGVGAIGDLADSGGMQLGNGFTRFEKIHHPVPAIDVHGLFNFGPNINVIAEYVAALDRFNHHDMSFNHHSPKPWLFGRHEKHGAQPWALDTQVAYSFYILNDRPSSIGLGFGKSSQALSLGIPLTRTSVVFNTSLWRNTLQSLEFRHDKNYAESDCANGPTEAEPRRGACVAARCKASGKSDNAVTAQFDYYF